MQIRLKQSADKDPATELSSETERMLRRAVSAHGNTDQTSEPRPASANGFNFRAETSTGHSADYYMPIEDAGAVHTALERAGMQIKQISPRRSVRRKRGRVPKRTELAQIAHQLGDQWAATGSPIQVLEALAKATPNRLVASALENAASDVRNGGTVSDALAAQDTTTAEPDAAKRARLIASGKLAQPIFPLEFSHAIRIAEATGAITDPVTGEKRVAISVLMERFAIDQIRIDKFWAAIKGAAIYPIVLCVALIVTVAVMLYVVVPGMQELYTTLLNDAPLPLPTRILVFASNFMISPLGITSFCSLILGTAGFVWWSTRTPKGQDFVARRSLWIPLFGEMMREAHTATFARTLGMLASGGGNIKGSLKETARSMSNPVYREMLEDIAFEMNRDARELHILFRPYTPLVTESLHPALVSYETSGMLDVKLARLAAQLEMIGERRVEAITHVVKNYTIIPLAILAGAVIVALYLPMLDVIGRLANHH